MVVQKTAHIAVQFAGKDQLPGEENRAGKFAGYGLAEAMQLEGDIGTDTGTKLGIEPQIGPEAAVLDQIVSQFLLELLDLFRSLELRRIDLRDADENDVVELISKQPLDGGQGGQTQAIEATYQDHGGGRVRVALGRGFLCRGKNLRQNIRFKLFDRAPHPFVMHPHRIAKRDQSASYRDRHPAAVIEFECYRKR